MQQNDNEQVKIEWWKAPEGATHYSKDYDAFYKLVDDNFMLFSLMFCEWRPTDYKFGQKMDSADIEFAKNLIERPKEETPDPIENFIFDWSIAPDKATHFCKDNSNWYEILPDYELVFYYCENGEWRRSIHNINDETFLESLIPRPQETNTAPYIDWSKAPEGTTHIIVNSDWKISADGLPGCASQWEMHKDNECYEYCAENKEWQFFAYADNITKEGMSWRIAKPAIAKPLAAIPIDESLQFKTFEATVDQVSFAIDAQPQHDPVNNPQHYTSHPSGISCIQVVEHMNFCIGNAIKYLWRADLKNDAIEDLKKARWYIDREISRREKAE